MSTIIANLKEFTDMTELEKLARLPCRIDGTADGSNVCNCVPCQARNKVTDDCWDFANHFTTDARTSGMSRKEFVEEGTGKGRNVYKGLM